MSIILQPMIVQIQHGYGRETPTPWIWQGHRPYRKRLSIRHKMTRYVAYIEITKHHSIRLQRLSTVSIPPIIDSQQRQWISD